MISKGSFCYYLIVTPMTVEFYSQMLRMLCPIIDLFLVQKSWKISAAKVKYLLTIITMIMFIYLCEISLFITNNLICPFSFK